MHLSPYLSSEAILLGLRARTREDLFPDLVGGLCRAYGWEDRGDLLDGIWQRERKMSTAVGLGIAIPHVRTDRFEGLHAAVAVCPDGVDFGAADGKPVNLVVLLVSSSLASGLHVKALAAVARISKPWIGELLGAREPVEFLERLKEGERKFLTP